MDVNRRTLPHLVYSWLVTIVAHLHILGDITVFLTKSFI